MQRFGARRHAQLLLVQPEGQALAVPRAQLAGLTDDGGPRFWQIGRHVRGRNPLVRRRRHQVVTDLPATQQGNGSNIREGRVPRRDPRCQRLQRIEPRLVAGPQAGCVIALASMVALAQPASLLCQQRLSRGSLRRGKRFREVGCDRGVELSQLRISADSALGRGCRLGAVDAGCPDWQRRQRQDQRDNQGCGGTDGGAPGVAEWGGEGAGGTKGLGISVAR